MPVETGPYFVTVTDNYGVISADTVLVEYPVYNLTISDTLICANDQIEISTKLSQKELYSYLWSNGETDHTISVNLPGEYWVTITDSLGCFVQSDTISIFVDYFPGEYSLGSDIEACAGNVLEALPGIDPAEYSFLWSDGSELPFIELTETGEYTVLITNSNGCIASDSIFVEITGIAPTVLFSSLDQVCLGSDLVFSDMSESVGSDEIISWYWDFGDGSFSQEQNPEHSYITSGEKNVILTVTAASGCSNFFNKTVEVFPLPEAHFWNSETCAGYTVQFLDESQTPVDENIVSWFWDFGDNNFSVLQNPTHIFQNGGIYSPQLTVTSENGCLSSYSTEINVPETFEEVNEFTLVHPSPSQFVYNKEVVFSWNFPENAYAFVLEVSEDQNMANILTSLETFEQEATINLPDFGTFFWRVKAFNVCRDTTSSSISSVIFFHPSQLEEGVFWLSADSLVETMDGFVSEWSDISGNGFQAVQSLESFRPSFVQDVINNRPVVRFNNAFLFSDFGTTFVQPNTIFIT